MPDVDGHTRSDDMPDGEGFSLAVRARMAWGLRTSRPAAAGRGDLVGSSAAAVPGYRVVAEAEERLGVRDHAETVSAASRRPLGRPCASAPTGTGARTSADFD
jgi:hypothetical protein